MIQITFFFNAIHLEAARRLHLGAAQDSLARRKWPTPVLQELVLEGSRLRLAPYDRQLWPLRLRIQPAVMASLALITSLGPTRQQPKVLSGCAPFVCRTN